MTPVLLGQDHDAERFHAPAAPSEIGSVVSRHRHGGLLGLQVLHHDIRPSWAQNIQHLGPVDAIVRNHHQSRVIAAGHPCETRPAAISSYVAPSGPEHPVGHVGADERRWVNQPVSVLG